MHTTHAPSGALSLRELLPRGRLLFAADIFARSCSADWRACRGGDVFFAITTAEDDGHQHAAEAVARGAIAVVAERLLPVDVPQMLVRDSRAAFARTCHALAGFPSRHLQAIGITGTAGKTVTSILLASILEAAGQRAGAMSSIGNSDWLAQRPTTSGTPTAAEFAAWLRRMTVAGCDAAVIELSSVALAERRAAGIALDAAVLTNIQSGAVHEHHSPRARRQIMQRVFKLLKPGGLAIVNADGHRCRGMLAELAAPCLTYALHGEADVTACVLERSIAEQTFFVTAGDQTVPVRTRMIGDHHVSNCLAAAAAGLALGIDLETIVRGLEAVERVPGRLERVECGQPFGVFLDAAAAPETVALALKTVRQVTRGRVFAVCGAGRKQGEAGKALLGRVLERGADLPIITSRDGRPLTTLEAAHGVLDGFERPHKAHVIPDRWAAIRFALSQARTGDCVLIAGCERLADDEREIAREGLYSSSRCQPGLPCLRIIRRAG